MQIAYYTYRAYQTPFYKNRQINDNLEQQAQALFKSWFVDFEPFKDGEICGFRTWDDTRRVESWKSFGYCKTL